MSNKDKKKVSGKRIALILLIVFLAIVLVVLVAGTILVTSTLNKLTRPDQIETLSPSEIEAILNEGKDEVTDYIEETVETDPNATEETVDPIEITEPTGPVEQIVSEENQDNFLNIMLVGQDAYAKPTQRNRSDTMILCTLDKSTKTLTMTSFMRDTYVKIPGFYGQRMNTAYMLGGFETLYDTLEYNFGVQVDKGVAVNFRSFRAIIEMIGGIDVELSAAEASYLNECTWRTEYTEGLNHLDGEAALFYARTRKVGSGDFERTERQRKVISLLIDKFKELSLTEIYNLVDTMLPMVHTDMSNAEIVALVVELAPMLKDLKIESQRIPLDDAYRMTMVEGMSVLLPDYQKNRQFLVDTIGDAQ